MYFSVHPYVFPCITLLFVINTLIFYNSSIICLLCAAVFQDLIFCHPIKMNETIPRVELFHMLMINLTDLNH